MLQSQMKMLLILVLQPFPEPTLLQQVAQLLIVALKKSLVPQQFPQVDKLLLSTPQQITSQLQ